MPDGGVRDQTQARLAKPFPVYNILAHQRGLELLLCLKVKDLDCSRLCFQGNNISRPVHDGTVCINRTLDDLIVVLEVDDDDLRFVGLVDLLSHANIVVGF